MNESSDIVVFGPRKCGRHPGQQVSSADGLFDAPCPVCEYEMEQDAYLYGDPSFDTREEKESIYEPEPFSPVGEDETVSDDIPF